MRTVTLGKKLGVGFGFVLLLFGVVIMIYRSTVQTIQDGYDDLMRGEMIIARHAGDIETYMLQMRRHEKDFLLRKDQQYAKQMQATYAKLQAEIQNLARFGRQVGDPEMVRKAEEMRRHAETYSTAFQQVVEAWVKRGLDHNSGLQGAFRDAVHKLEAVLAQHEGAGLYQTLLFLRRWEKDFVRTRADKYHQRLLTTLDTYKQLLEKSAFASKAKQAQQQALAAYADAFKAYLAAADAAAEAQAYERMRHSAHAMETAIKQTFIPQAQALWLQIRRYEKDYLLRGLPKDVEQTHKAVAVLKRRVETSGILPAYVTSIVPLLETYQQTFDALVAKDKDITALVALMREAIHQIAPLVAEVKQQAQTAMTAALQTTDQQANRNSTIALGIGIGAVLLGILVAWLMTRTVAKPLVQMANVADKLAVGDINQEVTYRASDEVGRLAEAFRGLIAYTKGVAAAAVALGKGDLTTQIEAKSERDVLSRNFRQATEHLRDMVDETQTLLQAAQAGKLDTRSDTTRFEGAFREVIGGINAMLDATLAPIQETAEVLDRVTSQDLTARVQGVYQGDHARIAKALNTTIAKLDESLAQVAIGAEQVASAAGQISSGSQSLAQGAAEQASSLQEVSSSLQELSSMSQQNTANAQEARHLTDSARSSADKGAESMQRLSAAIDRIKTSSDETAKIVKTINDIAFQTNLLALNAAVEAARAGDAGKGFAVVAEEVRNLAMRSAEAAKDTARLIEEAVQNAESGVNLNQEVQTNLKEIIGQVQKVSEVMEEIAAASEQQEQGVRQINTAVEQMNQVTQQNAANSEESASAAEELSAQAATMQKMVGAFRLTEARHQPSDSRPQASLQAGWFPASKAVQQRPTPPKALSLESHRNGHGDTAPVVPEHIIPFDDDNNRDVLKEF